MVQVKKSKIYKKQALTGFLYISPWLFGFLVFSIYPMFYSFYLSFFDGDLFSEKTFIGILNYVNILKDPNGTFTIAFYNTILYTLGSTIISIVFGILVGYYLVKKNVFSTASRTILFLPGLVIPMAFAMMMVPVFNPTETGLINQILATFGKDPQRWLVMRGQAVWVLIFMSLWGLGTPMLIFLAAFKNIDSAILEAAEVDGASEVQRFFKINLPLIMPVVIYQFIVSLIYGMQVFDLALGLAQTTGVNIAAMGVNKSLATLVYYLYNVSFQDYQAGLGSALGWIIYVIIAGFSIVALILIKRGKYYTLD